MALNDDPRRGRHDLDDAIDRVVRDMTRVEATDDAVARVMARVRGARDSRATVVGSWVWLPRAAWSVAAAAVLMIAVVVANYVMRQPVPELLITSRPMPAVELHPPAIPSGSIARATRPVARGPASAGTDTTTRATSIVEAANAAPANAEAAEEFHSDLLPRESDIAMSGIAPPPLAESPALTVEPLGAHALVVHPIDPNPIAVPPPVGPQR